MHAGKWTPREKHRRVRVESLADLHHWKCHPILKLVKAVVIALMGIIILLVEGAQKEPSQFEHPKHMLKLMGKKNIYNFTL